MEKTSNYLNKTEFFSPNTGMKYHHIPGTLY